VYYVYVCYVYVYYVYYVARDLPQALHLPISGDTRQVCYICIYVYMYVYIYV
jgi:hypothetical protein